MICCYQITKFFSTRYGSANASSSRGPCDFGPVTDLAISVFREMSIHTVLAQILTSLECGLQRGFMRRTGVRISLYWNSIIHQIFPECLQPLRDLRIQRVAQCYRGLLFIFVMLLAWVLSGRPDLSSTEVDTCTGEINVNSIFSFSSLNFTCCR